MTLDERLELATLYLHDTLKWFAPKLTGNLAFNSIRLAQIEPKHWQVLIGGEIAPYAVKTNEENKTSKGWVEAAIQYSKPMMENLMSGALSESEFNEELAKMKTNVKNEFERLIKRVEAEL